MFVWTLHDVVGVAILVMFMAGAFLYGVTLAALHLVDWAKVKLSDVDRRWRK